MFMAQIVVMVSQVYSAFSCLQTHRVVHIKHVQLFVCQQQLKKVIKKYHRPLIKQNTRLVEIPSQNQQLQFPKKTYLSLSPAHFCQFLGALLSQKQKMARKQQSAFVSRRVVTNSKMSHVSLLSLSLIYLFNKYL